MADAKKLLQPDVLLTLLKWILAKANNRASLHTLPLRNKPIFGHFPAKPSENPHDNARTCGLVVSNLFFLSPHPQRLNMLLSGMEFRKNSSLNEIPGYMPKRPFQFAVGDLPSRLNALTPQRLNASTP
jgi:hypothetical protein